MRCLECEPGLSGAPGAGEHEQPHLFANQQPAELRELVPPPDEGIRRCRQDGTRFLRDTRDRKRRIVSEDPVLERA